MNLRAVAAGLLFLFSCTHKSVDKLHNTPPEKHKKEIYRKLSFDRFGRHVFSGRTLIEPVSVGKKYHIVLVDAKNSRIVSSYQVENVRYRGKGDYKKSLRIMYDWTGKGFMFGLRTATGIMSSPSARGEAILIQMSVAGISLVFFTSGGFVIGVADAAWVEGSRPMVNSAAVITGRTEYRYDEKGRIREVLQYAPTVKPVLLVTTSFSYEGDRTVPSMTVIESIPDGKRHVLKDFR